ncbi:hypothetical protein ACI782_04695 [Geodermatophilus sp. SYSU D00703]
MGLLDRLFGRRRPAYDDEYGRAHAYDAPAPPPQGRSDDERAIERYRYLLRTAPPDKIEEAHAEAFAQLTPEQRRQVLDQLAAAGERARGDDPRSLARAATRAEMRRPGTLERAFGGYGGGYGRGGYGRGGYGPGYGGGGFGGPSFGSMMGASLLGTVGGLVVGTAVADALFDTGLGDGGLFGGGDEEAYAEGYADGADAGDPGGDFASGAEGGWGASGGDFGGGDFGGDFGGGGEF